MFKTILPQGDRCARNILIVDDHPEIRRLFRRLYYFRFDKIYEAGTSQEAEQIIYEKDINLVLCDWDLADGDTTGEYLVDKWRKENQGIRLAVVWTGSDLDNVKKLKSVDVVASKGTDLEEIVSLFK